ncbi:MAG: hypothetical protein LUD81_01120, partial [Clostridiales bacterium]|nr:hypothetical protein [Clostridiales bacterium]
IKDMLSEISEKAQLLSEDYENPQLADLKNNFSPYYMTMDDKYLDDEYNETVVKENIETVIDFYSRFVKRMNKMMEDNPETNLISIMGP